MTTTAISSWNKVQVTVTDDAGTKTVTISTDEARQLGRAASTAASLAEASSPKPAVA
jgi:hypothetical protein